MEKTFQPHIFFLYLRDQVFFFPFYMKTPIMMCSIFWNIKGTNGFLFARWELRFSADSVIKKPEQLSGEESLSTFWPRIQWDTQGWTRQSLIRHLWYTLYFLNGDRQGGVPLYTVFIRLKTGNFKMLILCNLCCLQNGKEKNKKSTEMCLYG